MVRLAAVHASAIGTAIADAGARDLMNCSITCRPEGESFTIHQMDAQVIGKAHILCVMRKSMQCDRADRRVVWRGNIPRIELPHSFLQFRLFSAEIASRAPVR